MAPRTSKRCSGSMGRKDLDPEDRDQEPLIRESIVECPSCQTEFEVVFQAPDGIFETEDLEDPIEQQVECPECSTSFIAKFEGWVVHGDAG